MKTVPLRSGHFERILESKDSLQGTPQGFGGFLKLKWGDLITHLYLAN